LLLFEEVLLLLLPAEELPELPELFPRLNRSFSNLIRSICNCLISFSCCSLFISSKDLVFGAPPKLVDIGPKSYKSCCANTLAEHSTSKATKSAKFLLLIWLFGHAAFFEMASASITLLLQSNICNIIIYFELIILFPFK
jgi:hypothetical protein